MGVGAWKAPELPGVADCCPRSSSSCVLGVVAARPAAVGGGAPAAALTVKSVPVTTVTCEPGFTCVGSTAMITAPDMELATACAAASSAGVLDA